VAVEARKIKMTQSFPYQNPELAIDERVDDLLGRMSWEEKVAQLGDEKGSVEWARSVCERYHCLVCGKPLFRGAQRCRECKSPVADDLDGSL